MNRILILLILLAGFSCQVSKEEKRTVSSSNLYAHGFEIVDKEDFVKLTVKNPWEEAKNISIDYYLLEKGKTIQDSLKGKNIIYTPVEKIVCLSTSHLAFLEAINEDHKVVGVSGADYVSNKGIAERIRKGEIVDVGYGQNLNYELLVQQKPDLVMVYGIGSEVSALVRKLADLGIPAILNGEYLEEKPLGKAEWVKFVAALFQKEAQADSFFVGIEKDYLELSNLVKTMNNSPKVMVGSPYKDSWWVPGGNSYLANLIADAGGDYLGKENTTHESCVVSFENAFAWASTADVWINMSSLKSKDEIIASDSRFKNLDVLNHGRVFNNIHRVTETGGNDFWESGTVYPNLILKDLIKVFYPSLLKEVDFTYYEEIK